MAVTYPSSPQSDGEHDYPGYPVSVPPYDYTTGPDVEPASPRLAPPQFERPVTSAWATASLVFALVGLPLACCTFGAFSAVAVLCGHLGLIDTKTRPGRGMAVAGLILGYLVVGPAVVLSAIAVFGD